MGRSIGFLLILVVVFGVANSSLLDPDEEDDFFSRPFPSFKSFFRLVVALVLYLLSGIYL